MDGSGASLSAENPRKRSKRKSSPTTAAASASEGVSSRTRSKIASHTSHSSSTSSASTKDTSGPQQASGTKAAATHGSSKSSSSSSSRKKARRTKNTKSSESSSSKAGQEQGSDQQATSAKPTRRQRSNRSKKRNTGEAGDTEQPSASSKRAPRKKAKRASSKKNQQGGDAAQAGTDTTSASLSSSRAEAFAERRRPSRQRGGRQPPTASSSAAAASSSSSHNRNRGHHWLPSTSADAQRFPGYTLPHGQPSAPNMAQQGFPFRMPFGGMFMQMARGQDNGLVEGLKSDDFMRKDAALESLNTKFLMEEPSHWSHLPFEAIIDALNNIIQSPRPEDAHLASRAARAASNLVEALPQMARAVTRLTPAMVSRLQQMDMEFAEAGLTCLKRLSREAPREMLTADVVPTVTMMIDFFMGATQKDAIELISHAVAVCDPAVFNAHVRGAVAGLTQFLGMFAVRDPAVVESTCVVFQKLVENLAPKPNAVEAVASEGLPGVFLKILQATPLPVGRQGVTAILSTMALMTEVSDGIAVTMLGDDNFLPVLRAALTQAKKRDVEEAGDEEEGENGAQAGEDGIGEGSREPREPRAAEGAGGGDGQDNGGASQDQAQEGSGGASAKLHLSAAQLRHVVAMVRNSLPPLPKEHPFSKFDREVLPPEPEVVWQWQVEGSSWLSYAALANPHIEHAYANGTRTVRLQVGSQPYTIDLRRMRQVNESTRTARSIRRVVQDPPSRPAGDKLRAHFAKHEDALASMIGALLRPLFELYLATAHQDVHTEFAHALVRMVHAASPATLLESLKALSISNYLGQMLHSREVVVIMGALTTAARLLDQLPDIFRLHFRRKGVLHRIEQLTKMRVETTAPTAPTPAPAASSTAGVSATADDGSGGAQASAEPSLTRKQRLKQAKGYAYDYAREAFTTVLEETREDTASDPTVQQVSSVAKALEEAISPFAADKARASLQGLCAMCKDTSDKAMTAFEFSHYNMAHALARYLSSHDSATPERLKLFAGQFLTRDEEQGQVLQRLLDLVHSALNLNENFEPSGRSKHLGRNAFNVVVTRNKEEKQLPSVRLDLNVPYTVTVQALYDHVENALQGVSENESLNHMRQRLRRQREMQHLQREQQTRRQAGSGGGGAQSREGEDGEEQRRRRSGRRRRQARTAPETAQQGQESTGSDNASNSNSNGDNAGNEPGGSGRGSSRGRRRSQRRQQGPGGNSNSNGAEAADGDREEALALLRSLARTFGHDVAGLDAHADEDDVDAVVEDEEAEEHFGDDDSGEDQDEPGLEQDLLFEMEQEAAEQEEEAPAAVQEQVVVDTLSGTEDGAQQQGGEQEAQQASGGETAQAQDSSSVEGDASTSRASGQERGRDESMSSTLRTYLRAREMRRRAEQMQSSRHRGHRGQQRSQQNRRSTVHVTGGKDWWKLIAKGFRNKNKLDLLLNGEVMPWNYSMIQMVREMAPTRRTTRRSSRRRSGRGGGGVGGDGGTAAEDAASSQDLPSRVQVEFRTASARSRQVSSHSLHASAASNADAKTLGLPASAKWITRAEEVADLLRILRALHVLSTDGKRWIGSAAKDVALSPSAFINRRLAAKIMREVANTQALIRGTFPPWVTDTMLCCPFVLSYDQRVRFFRYTAFGCALGLRYLTGDAEEGDSQPLAQSKVVVPRDHLLAATAHVMHAYATHPTELSVSFAGEVGTGLGPTLEYFARTCEQFQRKDLCLWRDSTRQPQPSSSSATSKAGEAAVDAFVFSPQGLYPKPVSRLGEREGYIFELFGAFVAKAMQDNRPLDLNLSRAFYGWMVGSPPSSLADVRDVDEELHRSLTKLQAAADAKAQVDQDTSLDEPTRKEQLTAIDVDGCAVEDLCLDFTLPGYPEVAIGHSGADTAVTLDNVGEYVAAVVDYTLVRGVQTAMDSFSAGFNAVFDMDSLRLFTVEEASSVVCGERAESWTYDELRACIKTGHGYDSTSPQVQHLIMVLLDLDAEHKRKFVQFLTGSPNLPVGGFKALKPPFTVVMKDPQGLSPDQLLPSVMTCQNYFKLPTYSSKEVLRERLLTAITEGQGSFDLS